MRQFYIDNGLWDGEVRWQQEPMSIADAESVGMVNRKKVNQPCGTYNTRVVMTRSVDIDGYATIRRRACNRCEHRWYSGQGPESVVKVDWEGSKQRCEITRIYELDPLTGKRFASYSGTPGLCGDSAVVTHETPEAAA